MPNEHIQLGMMVALAVLALGALGWLADRYHRGQPVLAQERFPNLPWDGGDVIVVLGIFLLSNILAGSWLHSTLGAPETWSSAAELDSTTTESESAPDVTSDHPMIQLFSKTESMLVVVVVFASVAIIAPLTEEFLFRLVLLGWLLKKERVYRRRVLGKWPLGIASLLLTSAMFASLHFRMGGRPMDTEILTVMCLVDAIAKLSFFATSLAYLRFRHGRTWTFFGISSGRLRYDLKVVAIAFCAVVIPILFLQAGLRLLLADVVAPDPIPIFILAMAFGFLFVRTGRLTASILLHVALNTFSLLMLIAFGSG